MQQVINTKASAATTSAEPFHWVREIHTLGPAGTNCERAAIDWARTRCPKAVVALQPTMEDAAHEVCQRDCAVLLSVVAYPELHTIIYTHLQKLRLTDMFIMNTDAMVLASRTGEPAILCATHRSPEKLLPADVRRRFVASNAVAARDCAEGNADSCITTACAAAAHGLTVMKTYGSIPMGFTIHTPHDRSCASLAQLASLPI